MTPWTQDVQVLWRPELSFFEKRSALLRQLEEAGLLVQFQFGVDNVSVRIGEFEDFVVGVGGANCRVLSPTADAGRVRLALDMALGALRPRDVVLAGLRIRCFEALEGSSPEALQAATGERLMSDWMPSATAVDWAFLLDGRTGMAPGLFTVEFGVVSEEEAMLRLGAPHLGRVGPAELPFQPDTRDLPACSFFFDWSWVASVATNAGTEFAEVATAWDAILNASQKLSEEVRSGYMTAIVEEAHG